MPRSVKEWFGDTPDTAVPPRVRLRVLEAFNFRCDELDGGCGRPIRTGDRWTCDHKKAIINGGENREKNLHPLCSWCDPPKTAGDVAEKSAVYQSKLRHNGIKPKFKGRPLIGTKASGWKHKMSGQWVRR